VGSPDLLRPAAQGRNRAAPDRCPDHRWVHAREWGGSDVCVAFTTNLLRSYRTGSPLQYGDKTFAAADVRAILDDLDVFVVADVTRTARPTPSRPTRAGRRASGGARTAAGTG